MPWDLVPNGHGSCVSLLQPACLCISSSRSEPEQTRTPRTLALTWPPIYCKTAVTMQHTHSVAVLTSSISTTGCLPLQILYWTNKVNSSLWLLTCPTDNGILYESDRSPGKSQWLRVLAHRCRGQQIPSKQPSLFCTMTAVTQPPCTMAQLLWLWQQGPS